MKEDFVFSDLVYECPDFVALSKEIEKITTKVKTATSYAEIREAMFDIEAMKEDISMAYNLAFIRNFQDPTDEYYVNEVQKVSEGVTLADFNELNIALLESPFAGDIDNEFGEAYLDKVRIDLKVHGKGKELMVEEQMLVAKYQQLKAGLKYEFDGKELSEAELKKYYDSTDREVRRKAKTVFYDVHMEHRDEFEDILNKLIKVRIEIAKANGFDSYLDYMNLEKGRKGYGEKELNAFCEEVKKDLVPFYSVLYKAQAKRIGVPKLASYDYNIVFPDGNPEPAGDATYLLNAAKEMYHDLSKESGEFIDFMLKHELIDAEASSKKIANMGFCTHIEKYKLPFIFGNCNGTAWDVIVVTHEVGHALQGYLSMRKQKLIDYYDGGNDIAEVPSKTMEQFAYPYAEKFFGKDAEKFKFLHLSEALIEIGSYSSLNEFENYVYSNPEASTKERALEYNRIKKLYDPELDNSEFTEYIEAGCDLYGNMALYMFPKYVISYALSAMGAMEFKKKMIADKENGWKDYMALCEAGGSLSYPELLKLANISLPYKEGSVASATAVAKKILQEYIDKESN